DDDAVLLASDGLFKTLELDEMRACCTGSPQSWPEQLVEATMAKKREYQDNVTVLSLALGSVHTLGLPATAPPRTVRRVPDSGTDLPKTVRMSPAPPAAEPPPAAAPQETWSPPVQAIPVEAPRPKSNFLIVLLVLAVVASAGAAGWYYMQHRPGLRPQQPQSGPGVQAPHRDPMPPPVIDPK